MKAALARPVADTARRLGQAAVQGLPTDVDHIDDRRVDATRTIRVEARAEDVAAPTGHALAVRIERAGGATHTVALDDRLTIGRLGTADINIDAGTVSRLHAVLQRAGAGALVTDCQSHNGTVVERAAVRHALPAGGAMLLAVGDVVVVGDAARLQLVVAGAQERPAASLRSAAGARLAAELASAARTRLPVVLYGPSGAGKTHAARRLHEQSAAAAAPFVVVNCARLPTDPSTLHSELLGHKKGAFTGALSDRRGRLSQAHGGTVFFDEVESMPPLAQGFLLDVLEGSGDVVPLGGGARDALSLQFRVVSASKAPLSSSGLRRDLCERLAEGHLLVVPGLDQRVQDIEALARGFAEEQAALLGRGVSLDDGCLRALEAAAWPGHVRQLRAAVMTMAQVAAGERAAGVPVTLDVSAFQRWHATRAAVFDGAAAPAAAATPVASPATGASPPAGGDDDRLIPAGAGGAARRTSAERPILGEQARLLKREDVLRALEQSNGNQAAAARLLGVARNTLLKRIKQFEIPPDHGAPR